MDPEVDNEDAQALSDVMDAEVRGRLFQRCRPKQHPHCFVPFPKGWKVDCAHERRQTFHLRLKVEWERFVRTRNLREGLACDTDVESNRSGSSSGE